MSFVPTANPIHSSGSANSLQHLADTGCFICGESQEEKGEELLEIKSPCQCNFLCHQSCWEGKKDNTCPSCKKAIPAYVKVKEKQVNTYRPIIILILAILIFIGFLIGIALSFK